MVYCWSGICWCVLWDLLCFSTFITFPSLHPGNFCKPLGLYVLVSLCSCDSLADTLNAEIFFELCMWINPPGCNLPPLAWQTINYLYPYATLNLSFSLFRDRKAILVPLATPEIKWVPIHVIIIIFFFTFHRRRIKGIYKTRGLRDSRDHITEKS